MYSVEVLNQLEDKTFAYLLDSLKRQYNIENEVMLDSRESSSLLPSLSIEGVLGGVSSLLGGTLQQQTDQRSSSSSSAAIGLQQHQQQQQQQFPTISVNRCCPICMVDLNNDDIVLIMPCDPRHFFHRACVEHWLETSQACPICRANIVRLIMGTDEGQPPSEAGTSIEMQV
ncbi:zinc finger (C3HC4 RING finger) protein, putative [Eimeria maxima]|uniref:Zinc finger (C3HC4 RING finger) protein, putative n=1 Tax=Eimeria maxima TaxID=5804 RepID=U6MBM9_EIMMA|nr:zinc finger (C3HC4 RING finger) protein, putative [Eimeria maxima]CDJ59889.1 zinc finger (C3HC4 RING finger) protein, putative [Eimeria maxima]